VSVIQLLLRCVVGPSTDGISPKPEPKSRFKTGNGMWP